MVFEEIERPPPFLLKNTTVRFLVHRTKPTKKAHRGKSSQGGKTKQKQATSTKREVLRLMPPCAPAGGSAARPEPRALHSDSASVDKRDNGAEILCSKIIDFASSFPQIGVHQS
jgi:hypothetical protein